MKNKIKILNNEEIASLIKGIEDGDIIIDGRESKPLTPEEAEDYKRLRQEHYDANSEDEKEEIRALIEKLRKEECKKD